MESTPPHIRFKEARERLGLSVDDLAFECNEPPPCIRDIESCPGELYRVYSPAEIQKFCRALKIRPTELFAPDFSEPAVSVEELVRLIHQECHTRNVSLDQFEDAVGWCLGACIDPPTLLLEDMSVDGLQWLCRELRIDWRRVILGL